MMSIWEVLGIAPTTDKAAIRHAYAQKTRTCHPEEDPAGFDALHKAFTAAMRAARQGAGMAVMEQAAEESAAPVSPAHPEGGWEARSAAARAARAARRIAEQQAVEQYAGRAQRRAGRIIQLGQGQQEEGQQFDFAEVDAAPAQEVLPEQPEQPDRPLTHEERAWRNEPAPVPQREGSSRQPPAEEQTRPAKKKAQSPLAQRAWQVAALLALVFLVAGLAQEQYVKTVLMAIVLAWCGMQALKIDWNQGRFSNRILGLWGVGLVAVPVLFFALMATVWMMHGSRDATLDSAVGSVFLSILVAPFGLVSAFLAKKRATGQ